MTYLINVKNMILVCQFVICGVLCLGSMANAASFTVATEAQLYQALNIANKNRQADVIRLEPGIYALHHRLKFTEANTRLISTNSIPSSVILTGKGMKPSSSTEILIDVHSSNITISGITLQNVSNHLIQVRSEKNADNFVLTNCVLKDAYEQLLKVSSSTKSLHYSDDGLIENCLFKYTQGIGPQYYIGGIDAHKSKNWVIKNNRFEAIASPAIRVAEHAIHMWKDSSGTQVIGNTFINNDRGVGFGLGAQLPQHEGGLIQGNVFIHNASHHPYADASIILESAPQTSVFNNTIIQQHKYPNAIEYRFKATLAVKIKDNQVNRRIASRDNGEAKVTNNVQLQ